MPDKPDTPSTSGAPGAQPGGSGGAPTGGGSTGTVLPRRSPGHRGQDQRDTVAEMLQKAHEISLEAGSKMATVMKEVIFAAAGLAPFAAESARDLVNYMVRRGQMGSEEAERIRRDIEAAAEKRGTKLAPRPPEVEAKPAASYSRPTSAPRRTTTTSATAAKTATPKKAAAKKAAPAAKKTDKPAKKVAKKK